ncbi:MAG TPA: DegT/DnrJ/EryC1/StrS family aminotransferase [Terriglobia bacterium]|nr:DegT/DnrJ/EryC1/StrS family aminotransferase [Terriglobia bacterium]
MNEQLALLGGPKAVSDPLPSYLNRAGRTFGDAEERLLLEALNSGCLSRNGGVMVERLEREFAQKLGVAKAVACSTGTAAVHLTIAALDPEPGDEFITTPITDVGSLLPILWQNCIPVFADVDPQTLNLDPESVARQITPRTRAILAVHLAGQPCDMSALQRIAKEHGVALIEDCSQAYWAEVDGRLVGTVGDLACFSLQQSKHITCGEGGLMVTGNPQYAARAALFADKAWPRDTNGLGSSRFLFLSQNYRMTELQGAVALGQLPRIVDVVGRRRERAQQLTNLIENVQGVHPPHAPSYTRPAYWLYMLRVAESEAGVDTKQFGEALSAEGVPAWVQYTVDPLYLSPLFAGHKTYGTSSYPFSSFNTQDYRPGLCPQAEKVLKTIIAIHWNENYTPAHIEQIAAAITKVAHHYASCHVSS